MNRKYSFCYSQIGTVDRWEVENIRRANRNRSR
jgi:hypothetical protein